MASPSASSTSPSSSIRSFRPDRFLPLAKLSDLQSPSVRVTQREGGNFFALGGAPNLFVSSEIAFTNLRETGHRDIAVRVTKAEAVAFNEWTSKALSGSLASLGTANPSGSGLTPTMLSRKKIKLPPVDLRLPFYPDSRSEEDGYLMTIRLGKAFEDLFIVKSDSFSRGNFEDLVPGARIEAYFFMSLSRSTDENGNVTFYLAFYLSRIFAEYKDKPEPREIEEEKPYVPSFLGQSIHEA